MRVLVMGLLAVQIKEVAKANPDHDIRAWKEGSYRQLRALAQSADVCVVAVDFSKHRDVRTVEAVGARVLRVSGGAATIAAALSNL